MFEFFEEERKQLDAILRERAKKNPSIRCRTWKEFVATFELIPDKYDDARELLAKCGFSRLATEEGVSWLVWQFRESQKKWPRYFSEDHIDY